MNKYYKLIEISPTVAETYVEQKKPFVLLTDNPHETHAPGKIDFALHTQQGSAIVCNLESLIDGVELAV